MDNPAQAALASLRQNYAERLPAEFAALAALADRLNGSASDHPSLDEIARRLHKLAGSGGTFGFDALSKKARELELTAQGWLSGQPPARDAAMLRYFADNVAALSATLSASGLAQPEPVILGNAPAADACDANRIWLVEDDALLGRELAHQLEQFGYLVRLFTRLDQAEAAARAEFPDLLIMDVMFPEERANATEAVGNRPALRALGCPIFFISAYNDFSSRIRAARLGACCFFLKPLDVPRLVDRLESAFEERQAAPFRVLIVDDDVALAEYYRLVLSTAGMEVETLDNPVILLDRMADFRPDLVLMDMQMPEYSGPELAAMLRQHEDWLGLPIVYLSAESDLDAKITAMGIGADDFLTKPLSEAQLVAAVKVRATRFRQLADLMSKDSLTGLLKHSRIKEQLAVELIRARRNGQPLSAVMLDIDHFKRVNDDYGHAVGDRVIKAVAHLLKQRLRKSDSIGRYGGEEFVAVLPECASAMAMELMENIRERFAALRFRHNQQDFACTLSAGIACLEPSDAGLDAGALLIAADQALYAAKHGGRNRICLAEAAAGSSDER